MKRGISGYLVASLLLHLIIGIILLVGVDFSKPKRLESKGQIVNAVMLDSEFLEQQAQQIQQQKAQPKAAKQQKEKDKEDADQARRELAKEQERLRIAETKRKETEEATRKAETEKQKKVAEQKQAEVSKEMEALGASAKAEGDTFLAENAKKEGIQITNRSLF